VEEVAAAEVTRSAANGKSRGRREMFLQGRVALITGSTSGGMGRSTALTLAKNGADIVLNYGTNRRDSEADETSREVEEAIRKLGREVLLVKADTKSPEEVSAMVAEAVKKFQKIDILVNNAGGGWNPKDLAKVPAEQFKEVLEAEVCGAFHCIRECLPIMRKNRWGRIVNLGIIGAGYWAADGPSPIEYAIGKAGRALLTRHMALKERKHNITVNLVNPGPGHTAHFDTLKQALSFSDHGEEWPSRKKATPQDIADAVLFLCSEQAKFVTGSHITFSIE
jgi:NAD(P)-dependent dehydrogenase (short-subunit alcohol dehydrogenase family)